MQNSIKGLVTLISVSEATIYRLLPSATLIKVDTNGEIYVGNPLKCIATKIVGNIYKNCTSDEVTIFYTTTTQGTESTKQSYTWNSAITPSKNYDAYTFYLYKGTVTNPDTQILQDSVTIPIITDGLIDTFFKVWQGTQANPNNPLVSLWSDTNDSHIGDYYIATDGSYWKYTAVNTWTELTDPLLAEIKNSVSRSSTDGYYINCTNYTGTPSNYDTYVYGTIFNYFNGLSTLYKLGDLIELQRYKTYSESGTTKFSMNGENKIVYTEMYMCCALTRNSGEKYKGNDWILSTNLESRLYDAGIDITRNDITMTADRIKLKSTSGGTAADMNLFVKSDEGTEQKGLYINSNLLKIDGTVEFTNEDNTKTTLLNYVSGRLSSTNNYPGDTHVVNELIKKTTINGNQIETGTITTNLLNVNDVFGSTATFNGNVNANSLTIKASDVTQSAIDSTNKLWITNYKSAKLISSGTVLNASIELLDTDPVILFKRTINGKDSYYILSPLMMFNTTGFTAIQGYKIIDNNGISEYYCNKESTYYNKEDKYYQSNLESSLDGQYINYIDKSYFYIWENAPIQQMYMSADNGIDIYKDGGLNSIKLLTFNSFTGGTKTSNLLSGYYVKENIEDYVMFQKCNTSTTKNKGIFISGMSEEETISYFLTYNTSGTLLYSAINDLSNGSEEVELYLDSDGNSVYDDEDWVVAIFNLKSSNLLVKTS